MVIPDVLRMKKAIILIFVVFLAVLFGLWVWNGSGVRFVQKTTGVKFPDDRTDAKHFDTGNGFCCGTFVLPKDQIQAFLSTNKFRPVAEIPTHEDYLSDKTGKMPYPQQLSIFHVFKARKGFPTVIRDPSLMYLRGASEKSDWEYVVNPATGHLWYIFTYPDFGGK